VALSLSSLCSLCSLGFLDICHSDEKCKGLFINSFLIKPIQRLCKYPLLLRELIEHTPETHPDYQVLVTSKQKVCPSAWLSLSLSVHLSGRPARFSDRSLGHVCVVSLTLRCASHLLLLSSSPYRSRKWFLLSTKRSEKWRIWRKCTKLRSVSVWRFVTLWCLFPLSSESLVSPRTHSSMLHTRIFFVFLCCVCG
jgi:RhoGEF domain